MAGRRAVLNVEKLAILIAHLTPAEVQKVAPGQSKVIAAQ
jgi:hypothetical protein